MIENARKKDCKYAQEGKKPSRVASKRRLTELVPSASINPCFARAGGSAFEHKKRISTKAWRSEEIPHPENE